MVERRNEPREIFTVEVNMNREIRFRGKHVHALGANKHLNGTWVYGLLSAEDYISTTYDDGTYAEKLIDKNTIGQFIGENDKNGTPIYEFDIVEIERPCNGQKNWLVVFENGEFHLTSKYPDTNERLDIVNYDLVWESVNVIGNYFDNQELLLHSDDI